MGISNSWQLTFNALGHGQGWRVSECIELDARPYCCSFDPNGNFYYYATQDHKVTFKKYGNDEELLQFNATVGQWTITDYTLSSDGANIAWTSLVPYVHLAAIKTSSSSSCRMEQGAQQVLDFSNRTDGGDFGLFCIRFSSDGKELLAGSNSDSLYCYDIERQTLLTRIKGHDDDVNSVCFVDTLSSNVIVSASDDHLIKVWDRRSLKRNGQPTGTLIGHTEGITHVTSKGDGRSLLSNGKDQQLKLWDLRSSLSSSLSQSDTLASTDRLSPLRWDYRWQPYPLLQPRIHPLDTAMRTFTGHRVLRTLIRAHFSPPRTAGRYIYTGSADGHVWVWDTLTSDEWTLGVGEGCIRDVAWHPFDRMLVAGMWMEGGGRGRGSGGVLVKAEPDYFGAG